MSIKKALKFGKKTLEKSGVDKKVFARIKEKFREYWKILARLIIIYIVVYLVWIFSANLLTEYFKKRGKEIGNEKWTKESLLLAVVVITFQGLLFALDGRVTSLLKSPFNQMCYAINKAEGISDKKKDHIISKATESNEHCKETLKKFGILAISQELVRVFIQASTLTDTKKNGDYAAWLNISYLIPLIFAGLAIISISRELKKIEKNLVSANGK